MKMVLIQVVLIAVVIAVVARLFRSRGARAQAIRRIGLVLFASFAAVSILFPEVWNQIARVVGVGRGTDMVLYALVVAFLSFTVTTYLRFRDLETSYTRLARTIALSGATEPTPPTPPAAPEPLGPPEPPEGTNPPPPQGDRG